jgi:hypothetical protein
MKSLVIPTSEAMKPIVISTSEARRDLLFEGETHGSARKSRSLVAALLGMTGHVIPSEARNLLFSSLRSSE